MSVLEIVLYSIIGGGLTIFLIVNIVQLVKAILKKKKNQIEEETKDID